MGEPARDAVFVPGSGLDTDASRREAELPDALSDSMLVAAGRPWSAWNDKHGGIYTIGVEEEVMLLDPFGYAATQRSDFVLTQLSAELAEHTALETHASVVELVSGVHRGVAGAVAEMTALRDRLALELRPLGVAAACSGMHPLAASEETRLSGGDRYLEVASSMRSLAHREPTMALHVHVGVPDPEEAIRVLNRLRENVPILLALAANSPFTQGRDSGFASARTMIFGSFPRTGTARAFACFADYVQALDALIVPGALRDASFVWWDVRLQPRLGTVEVRVMDAQTSVADSAALIALIQSLARLELEGRSGYTPLPHEVLAENRFLAARDGLDARLIDPASRKLMPVRRQIVALLGKCREHAAALGCSAQIEQIARLATENGATRQRRWADELGTLARVVPRLADEFAARPIVSSRGNRHELGGSCG